MLPTSIQSVLDLCLAEPSNAGLFAALMDLLENAGDSDIITDALGRFPESWVHAAPENSRERAVTLLMQAEAGELASLWSSQTKPAESPEEESGRVVPLFRSESPALANTGIEMSRPDISMDDIAGLEAVKKQIYRKIVRPFENPGLYQKFRKKSGGGILLYGAPGCGKTMIAKAVASACKARFVEVRPSDIYGRHWGDAEQSIEAIFREARNSTPSVLFFDEVESLAHRRGMSDSAYKADVISTLLREMDGADSSREGILILGATNVPWSIDPAFKRPGRFDRTLFVPPPDRIARTYLLKRLLSGRPVSAALDTRQIIERTSGFSGADLESLVDTAIDFAIEESSGQDDVVELSKSHFDEALAEVGSSIGEWLALAGSYASHANLDGQYNDLQAFLKKHR